LQRIIASFALASLSLMAAHAIVATWPHQPAEIEVAIEQAASTGPTSNDAPGIDRVSITD
jgi:hypothetical protein